MARQATTVPFEEFSSHLEEFFDRVVQEGETIIVKKQEGEVAVIKPAAFKTRRRRKRKISEADHQAFIRAAGSWSDFDVDTFLENIYESRRMSSRPPVEL